MSNFIKYKHHGCFMWVRKDLKGKNAEYSLCFSCAKLKDCATVQALCEFDADWDVVTPVWECPEFVEKEK